MSHIYVYIYIYIYIIYIYIYMYTHKIYKKNNILGSVKSRIRLRTVFVAKHPRSWSGPKYMSRRLQ